MNPMDARMSNRYLQPIAEMDEDRGQQSYWSNQPKTNLNRRVTIQESTNRTRIYNREPSDDQYDNNSEPSSFEEAQMYSPRKSLQEPKEPSLYAQEMSQDYKTDDMQELSERMIAAPRPQTNRKSYMDPAVQQHMSVIESKRKSGYEDNKTKMSQVYDANDEDYYYEDDSERLLTGNDDQEWFSDDTELNNQVYANAEDVPEVPNIADESDRHPDQIMDLAQRQEIYPTLTTHCLKSFRCAINYEKEPILFAPLILKTKKGNPNRLLARENVPPVDHLQEALRSLPGNVLLPALQPWGMKIRTTTLAEVVKKERRVTPSFVLENPPKSV
ncbi:uncharacterized protein LOC113363905 [Ctenocephalides felis]|uniref:uncharacterized protein LOC113363905 n=1 Tax=Ctenocephalides felis TaxID=7515 RepID=UPI000E6E2EB2|nr:uncharacterized protein LOC113363905 [Ctenocephalides felis]